MGANSSTDVTSSELFQKISVKFSTIDPNLAKQLGGIFLFCIMKKQSVRYWTMDLNKVVVYPGEPEDDQDPDATFTMSEDIFEQVALGKTDARSVVQAGKCSVTGNIMKAMKLEPYMKL